MWNEGARNSVSGRREPSSKGGRLMPRHLTQGPVWLEGREGVGRGGLPGGHRVCEGLPGVLDLHSRSWLGPRHAPGAGGLWVWGNLASEGEASPGESRVKLQLSGRACEAPSPGTSQGQGRARRCRSPWTAKGL